MNIIEERYQIAIDRIREIKTEELVEKQYIRYFQTVSEFILKLDFVSGEIRQKRLDSYTPEQLEKLNKELYQEIYRENYVSSFANPTYAMKCLGEEYGRILCYLYKKIRDLTGSVYRGEMEIVTLRMELFIEVYNLFEDKEELGYDNLKEILYSFEKDNTEIFMEYSVDYAINPDKRFAVDIVTKSDLSDVRYLYQYGEHVGENEIKMAKYLNSLTQEKIDLLAHVYTEGYRRGFENAGKDLSMKETVDIRYNLGFERIVKSAIAEFEKMGLKPVIYPGGYQTTMPNKQYWFDHKFDEALYLDKAFVKRKLEVAEQAYEKRKDIAGKMAGPAVIEIFGENPFEPENKKEAPALTEEQQKLSTRYRTEYLQIVQTYIKGDERSLKKCLMPQCGLIHWMQKNTEKFSRKSLMPLTGQNMSEWWGKETIKPI